MDKYQLWVDNFAARDKLTAFVFALAAIILLIRAYLPDKAKRFIDPVLGGLYGVSFILVLAFYRPTL